jgi:membrane-bound inhibitor of C-type lysozyme
MKNIFCLCLALFLVSCNQNRTAHAAYSCEKGISFKVEFSNGEKVVLTDNNNSVTLLRVESSSGAKYENEGVMFETMGVDAAYIPRKDAKALRCRRN